MMLRGMDEFRKEYHPMNSMIDDSHKMDKCYMMKCMEVNCMRPSGKMYRNNMSDSSIFKPYMKNDTAIYHMHGGMQKK
jgi:hypothetical protein